MGNSPSSPRRRPKRERLRSPPPPGGDSGGDDVRAKTAEGDATNGDGQSKMENGRAARREVRGDNSNGLRRPTSRHSDGGRDPRNSSDNANRPDSSNSSSASSSSASSSSPPSPRSLRRHRPPPNRYVARPSKAGWSCDDGDAAFLMDRDDGRPRQKGEGGAREKHDGTTTSPGSTQNGGGKANKRPAPVAAAGPSPSPGRGGKSPNQKRSPAKKRAGTKGKQASASAKGAAKADRPTGKGKSRERGRASPRVWQCPRCRHINLPDRVRCRECHGRREGEGDEGEGDAGRRSNIHGHEGGAGANLPGRKRAGDANSPGKGRAADAKSPGKKGAEPAPSDREKGGDAGVSQKRRRKDPGPAGHTREEAAAWEAAGGWQCQICLRLNLPGAARCQGCGASRMTTKDGGEADEGATTKAPREAPTYNAAAPKGAAGKAEESDDESNYDDVACALCKCAVDWADADYFLPADAEEGAAQQPTGGRVDSSGREDDSMRSDDSGSDSEGSSSSDDDDDSDAPPFRLPRHFHDPANALVLCDGPVHADDDYACDRAYHQQCHFVPVLSIPRGPWRCLVCRQWDEDFLRRKQLAKKKKGQLKGEDRSARPGALSELFRCRPVHATAPTASAAIASAPNVETEEEESRIAAMERDFELRTGPLKARLLHAELATKSKAVVQSSFATLRSAAHALRSLTETPKARKSLAARIDTLGMPQELAQCVMRRAAAKVRVRELIGGLEDVIRCRAAREEADDCRGLKHEEAEELPRPVDGRGEDVVGELMRWYLRQQTQLEDGGGTATTAAATATAAGEKSLLHHLFPEGHARRRRLPPRTGEARSSQTDDDASDDSGISLDDLACWVCHGAHATDENDMLLCDGRGCYRAFHMQCLEPRISPEDCREDDDWFCPLCAAHGTLVHYAEQEHRLGDDREEEEAMGDDDEEEWECAADIFPEAPFELRVAQKFKEGARDEETDAFLADTLGIASSGASTVGRGPDGGSDRWGPGEDDDEDEEDDDEDEEDDDDFDHEDVDDDDADSLAEDLHEETRLGKESIGKDELDNLSVGSSDEEGSNEDDEDTSESGGGASGSASTEAPVCRRKRRRCAPPDDAARGTADAHRGRSPPPDAGTLDVANILRGPRRRAKVDYRKLADAMFGDAPDEEAKGAAKEYAFKARDFGSDNEEGDGDGDSDDDSGEEEEDAPKKKKARRSSRG